MYPVGLVAIPGAVDRPLSPSSFSLPSRSPEVDHRDADRIDAIHKVETRRPLAGTKPGGGRRVPSWVAKVNWYFVAHSPGVHAPRHLRPLQGALVQHVAFSGLPGQ